MPEMAGTIGPWLSPRLDEADMKNREIFLRDPVTEMIPNQGVATIAEAGSELELATLRYELQHFVCEGQYAVGLRRILQSFLACLSTGNPQKGIWVSGFYGSGKSHLVKVLRYLWTDFRFPDGSTARGLVSAIPDDVAELLRELDTAGKRYGGLHAAAGKVGDKTRSKDDIPLAVLQVVLQSLGLPDEYQAAQLYFYLVEKGALDKVKEEIESEGGNLDAELKNLYVSDPLRHALRKHCRDFADIPVDDMSAALRAQFPPTGGHIRVAEMAKSMETALTLKGGMPLTLLALDELQQFVGDSADRSSKVQEIVETCNNQFQAKLLFVATGQSAITETPYLQRLAGRFQEKISLTDADVETVTRTIVLSKKPDAKDAVQKVIEDHKGEIFRHLKGTAIAPKASDSETLVADYPILPSRRRFWERVLRAVDPTGTSTMLRTQLRLVDEAVRSAADKELGTVVAADFLFNQEKSALQNSGALLHEELHTIEKQPHDDPRHGVLKARICALCFLVAKLPKEGVGDIGVRATAENLADLLVEDLREGGAELRRLVPELLKELETANDLMLVDGEYRIQTREGSEWANDFENRKRKVLADRSKVAEVRTRYITSALSSEVRGVTVIQGQARMKRDLNLQHGQERPKQDGVRIPVWVRDGWAVSSKDVVTDAERAGQEDATVYVFVPSVADELTQAIASLEAAVETLAARGVPTTDEGRQARAAIDSRKSGYEQGVKDLISKAIAESSVFLGGGSEVDAQDTLKSTLQEACGKAATRLFPKFGQADDARWHHVVARARGGAGDPLQALGFTGVATDHPACKSILESLAYDKTGSEVRVRFTRPPYGWSQDAVDGALLALLAGGAILAVRQNKPVKPTELDQKTIGDTKFRAESVILTVAQRIELRKLFLKLDVRCTPNEEASTAPLFVQKALDLARSAGGDEPLPERPSAHELVVIKELTGNEQLLELLQRKDELPTQFDGWKKTRERIEARLPSWYVLKELLALATDLDSYEEFGRQVHAIHTQRQLVHEPDPIQPLVDSLSSELRAAFRGVTSEFIDYFHAETKKLEALEAWKSLGEDQRKGILTEARIREASLPEAGTTPQLIEQLKKAGLAQWHAELAALPSRFAQAATKAGQLIEPTSVTYTAPRKLLRTTDEVEQYVAEVKSELLAKVAHNPVQVS